MAVDETILSGMKVSVIEHFFVFFFLLWKSESIYNLAQAS